eukprot:6903445-Pyramimonas_sp.AAC.1
MRAVCLPRRQPRAARARCLDERLLVEQARDALVDLLALEPNEFDEHPRLRTSFLLFPEPSGKMFGAPSGRVRDDV